MGLMDALRTAQGSLAIQSTLGGIASTNVARATEEHYARRDAPTTTDAAGARLVRIGRATNGALEAARLDATTRSSGAETRATGIRALRDLFGGPDAEASPSVLLSDLRGALQTFAAEPGSVPGASAAVEKARSFAEGLNRIGRGIATLRSDADAAIARDVGELGRLLERFGEQNAAVVLASRTGTDGSDAADARARTLAEMAELLSFRMMERDHGDLVLVASGPEQAVLFDTVPRPVAFTPTNLTNALDAGASVILDGIAMTTAMGGRIGASLELRDAIAPDLAKQADALAAMAIETFADRSADGSVTAPGLFVDPSGSPVQDGLAARIALGAAFDPDQGGNPLALRDGAPSGPAAGRNPGNAAGFTAVLIERIEAIDEARALDPQLGLGDTVSLADATASQLGMLELRRSEAEGAREGAGSALERARAAHSNATGVNIDEEMARLVAIEQSYRAAARVLAVAETMFDDLFAATR